MSERTDLPPCSKKMRNKGTLLLMTHTIPVKEIEEWVAEVELLSGQQVDWYYEGGYALIKALGNIDLVIYVMKYIKHKHDEMFRKAALPDTPIPQLEYS